MQRHSYRVHIENDTGHRLAGIVDRPQHVVNETVPAAETALGEEAPVAVFSHCFTCSKDLKAIARVSRRLAELGIAVLRFDMTGLGGSQGDFSQTNFTTNLADLASAIRFAEQELGRPTALIGHSFGGAASLGIAAGMHDESLASTIQSVITLAAPSDTSHLAKLLAAMNPSIESTGEGQVEIGGSKWLIRKQMLDDFRTHALADALPRIRARVLAFHSPDDQTVHYDHALRIASLIRDANDQPTCSLVTLGGADHLLINQPGDAMLVAEMTAAFVSRHDS